MSSEALSTPKVTVTKDDKAKGDITQKERSPIEDAFYESFLLQSRSDVENLYASNIYYSQKHAKELKDLEREKAVCLTDMTKQQKDIMAKMSKLQEKQEKIMREKRKQQMKSLSRERVRPNSTSVVTTGQRRIPERSELKQRSGSLTLLQPFDFDRVSRNLSRSTELLNEVSLLNLPQSQSLTKSCEDLSSFNTKKSKAKVKLPSIDKALGGNFESDEVFSTDSDSTFVTKSPVTPSPPTNPKFLVPGFDPYRRRGSLDAHLARRRGNCELEPETQTKWVPRALSGRKKILPPI